MPSTDQLNKSVWMLASIAVVVAALYLAKDVLIPLTLAVLLSFLLSPACDRLERHGLGRIPAVAVTALIGFAVLGAATWTAAVQIADLAPKMPEYQKNLQAKLHSTNAFVSAGLHQISVVAENFGPTLSPSEQSEEPKGTSEHPFSVRVLPSTTSPAQLVGGSFGSLVQVLGSSGIVIVLVVFFLIRREDLRDRFIRLVGTGQVTVTTQMLEDAATRVSRYLSMLFIVNATFGISVGIGLSLIGVPNAVLWGILAAILRFIPYIGPWIAAAMPIGLSMAISTTWLAPIVAVALFVGLELLSNNVMEPWLYGKNTGMSAVAILVAAIFWAWLWGVAGLLLSTPLTVCLLVIGKHIPQLSFLETMLGNEPVFEFKKRVYQRLLAGDQEEAAELIDEYLQLKPLVEVYDSVLVPALVMAETHWHRGELAADRHRFILQSLKDIVEDLGQRPSDAPARTAAINATEFPGTSAAAEPTNSTPMCVVCVPARDEGDELAAAMLAQLLQTTGCAVQAVSLKNGIDEMIELVVQRQPPIVCVSAIPPAAVTHSRYLCARLRARMPNVILVVGLWDMTTDLTGAKKRIGSIPNTHLAATLADAQKLFRQLAATLGLPVQSRSSTAGHQADSTGIVQVTAP